MKVLISATIDVDVAMTLEAYSKEHDISKSSCVQEALNMFFEERGF